MSVTAVLLVLASFAVIFTHEYATIAGAGSRRDLLAFIVVTALAFALCFAAAMGWPVPNPAVAITAVSKVLIGLLPK